MRSPVGQRGDELGVPVLTPEHPRDPDFQDALRALAPDCCPVVAYGALLPQSALDIPPHGWVNLHFSALPTWRGAAPVQHSIWAGDEVTGATTFRLVKELDAGPTFGVMTERIRPTDTAGDLLDRLAEGGAGLLVATLDGIEDGSRRGPRRSRRTGSASRPKITVEDARVDWRHPAGLDRPPGARLHARSPGPGPRGGGAGQARPGAPRPRRPARPRPARGHQERRPRRHRHRRRCGSGDVKAFGKRQMPAADWARGLRVDAGARFGDG